MILTQTRGERFLNSESDKTNEETQPLFLGVRESIHHFSHSLTKNSIQKIVQ
jgi:hypothetical protein